MSTSKSDCTVRNKVFEDLEANHFLAGWIMLRRKQNTIKILPKSAFEFLFLLFPLPFLPSFLLLGLWSFWVGTIVG
jgi:hypothetical protein